ncbi:hypothetical protein [Actinocatenispora comari]|uniref:Uncharacterized protein n=1 Tax=Actinocatenispora comari TaxID=2807577 RepID=A0A8J4EMT3_9ACTN|nr:hypothetical protein [Actinocatenispora comari]GIL29108.1 hypothetical protein NUM_43620 [Actinocatenispora comari]
MSHHDAQSGETVVRAGYLALRHTHRRDTGPVFVLGVTRLYPLRLDLVTVAWNWAHAQEIVHIHADSNHARPEAGVFAYTCHIGSPASGMAATCLHTPSLAAARAAFAELVNDGGYDGVGADGPDAVMDIYPYGPNDTSEMSHGDYPLARWMVGARRNEQYTLRQVQV